MALSIHGGTVAVTPFVLGMTTRRKQDISPGDEFYTSKDT